MANQIVVSAGAKVRNLDGVLTGTSGVVSSLPIDGSLGIPQLDINGKILVSQLPNSVMEYKGTWDASTNTPTLADGTGNQGDVYLCNVAGTVDFGAGPIAFVVGDQVIYSGSIWQRASGATGTVTSVAITESGDSLNITGSPITTSGTINIGFNGTNLQYINGAGNLTTFPTLTGYVPYSGATANVNLGEYGLSGGFIGFDTTPTSTPTAQGTMYWNADKESVDVIMNGVTGSVMQDTFYNVKNQTGATITKGTIVRANGTVGASGRILIAPFLADGSYDSKVCLGVTAETILNGEDGKVTAFGAIRQIDTSAFANGTILYASPTTAGGFTSTEPTNPSNIVTIAIVVYSDVNNGEIFVRPTFVDNAADIAASLGYTPANDALVVHLAETETITGAKTFSTAIKADAGIRLKDGVATGGIGYVGIGSNTQGLTLGIYNAGTTYYQDLFFPYTNGYQYTFPALSGIVALTSDIPSITGLVPYTGATGAVNLGAFDLTVNGIKVGIGGGSGANNTRLGSDTLSSLTTASNNIAVGANALFSVTSGNANVGIGGNALYALTTGTINTAIGFTAGSSITTGSYNTIVGKYVGTATLDSNVVLADGIGNIRFQWDGTNILLNGNIVGSNAYNSTAYLPLSGGTLTGALIGTTALFNGSVDVLNGQINLSNSYYLTARNNANNTFLRLIGRNSSDKVVIDTDGYGTILGGALSGTSASFSSTIQGTILTATSYFKSDTYRDSRAETLISYQGSNNIRLGSGVGADYLTFLAGGTLKATLDTSGNLGLGVTPSEVLDVNGNIQSRNTFILYNGSQKWQQLFSGVDWLLRYNTGGTWSDRLMVTGGGNVLIGTTTDAGYKLDVNGTGRFTGKLTGANASFSANVSGDIAFDITNTNTTNGYGLRVQGGVGSTSYALNVVNAANTVDLFSVMGSGAATFSSSVTAQGYFALTTTSDAYAIQGTLSWNSARGTVISGKTASVFDFAVYGAASQALITNPTGTSVISFPSGNVGIGTSSPFSKFSIGTPAGISSFPTYSTSDQASIGWNYWTSAAEGYTRYMDIVAMGSPDGTYGGSVIRFLTNSITNGTTPTERMRITSGGFVKASNNGTYDNATGAYHEFRNTNTNATDNIAIVTTLGNTSNNSSNYHYIAATNSADKLYIYGNGNVVNVNGSYGTLSDFSLKENIVDATPKLADILQLKVRNFNLIGDDNKQIGFIAQEFEEIFPSMVDIDGKSGKKAIKTSVLTPMIVKGMQEMVIKYDTKIELLEAQIEQLKAQLK